MAIIKHTPYFLSAFLLGVAARSFFDISENLVLVGLGLCAGFWLALSVSPNAQILQDLAQSGGTSRAIRQQADMRVLAKFGAKAPPFLLVSAFFFLGIFRFSVFQGNIIDDQFHNHYGEILNIKGTVLSSEEKAKSSQIILETDLGRLLVVARAYPKYKYGNLAEAKGEVSEPKPYGDFDIKNYLAKDKIYAEMIFPEMKRAGHKPPNKVLAVLFGFKERFEESLEKILPQPHSLLAEGMLWGKEGAIDQTLIDAFRKTGTVHILVLSGYNITVVGIFLLAVFSYILPSAFAWAFSILGIILFTLMTGAEPAAVRASIMAVIGLFALRAGRLKSPADAPRLLLWAAFIMVLWNPMYLRFDRGFQLSFMATLGLALLASRFEKIFRFLPKFLGVRESASASLAAQIFVLPLLVSWGNSVSFWSPMVNVLVVGAVPIIMFSGFLGGAAAFLSQSLGAALAAPAFAFISYQIYIVNFFARF